MSKIATAIAAILKPTTTPTTPRATHAGTIATFTDFNPRHTPDRAALQGG